MFLFHILIDRHGKLLPARTKYALLNLLHWLIITSGRNGRIIIVLISLIAALTGSKPFCKCSSAVCENGSISVRVSDRSSSLASASSLVRSSYSYSSYVFVNKRLTYPSNLLHTSAFFLIDFSRVWRQIFSPRRLAVSIIVSAASPCVAVDCITLRHSFILIHKSGQEYAPSWLSFLLGPKPSCLHHVFVAVGCCRLNLAQINGRLRLKLVSRMLKCNNHARWPLALAKYDCRMHACGYLLQNGCKWSWHSNAGCCRLDSARINGKCT